jgi:lysophospholipase L1-like esterase
MKILFYGDSITDAQRDRSVDHYLSSYGFGYPSFVAGELLSKNPEQYEIINRGISGNRIVDLYARIKADVWNLQPDVLSILVGVNDVWHEINYNNGVELERFDKIYRMMLDDTLKVLPNVKIILCEPLQPIQPFSTSLIIPYAKGYAN